MLAGARAVTERFLADEEGWREAVNAFIEANPLLFETLSSYYSYYLFQYFLRTYETYSFRRQIILGLCHTNMVLLLAFCGGDATAGSLAMIIARYNRRAYFSDIIQNAMYKEAVRADSHTERILRIPPPEVYRKVYELTDSISPIESDCGRICAMACCRREAFDGDDESYIYLLPGEERVYGDPPEGLKLTVMDAKEHDFPASWGDKVTVASCEGPERCNRAFRPVQCRTYPLAPHINKKRELELIYSDIKTPYTCPLIYEKTQLTDDFIENTYEAWQILTEYEAIREFVAAESKKRKRYTKCTKNDCFAHDVRL